MDTLKFMSRMPIDSIEPWYHLLVALVYGFIGNGCVVLVIAVLPTFP